MRPKPCESNRSISAAPRRGVTWSRAGLPLVRSALALWVSLGLAACTLAPRAAEPLSVTAHTVLLVVPPVPQEELNECGLASLAVLCGYLDVAIPDELRQRLAALAREREGLSGEELRAALLELGLEAFLFRGSLDGTSTGLYHQIERGRLPLVMISRDGESLHTCLVTGFDLSTRSVYLYDPARGHLRLPEDDFDALWTKARHFTLLALPSTASAREPDPAVALPRPTHTFSVDFPPETP